MRDTIHVGVIGAGIGNSMAIPGFQFCRDAKVVAVCDCRQKWAEEVAQKFGIPHVFTDYRKMLELDGLDAVVVATPPYLHYPMTIAALEADKHVLCEKPMAINLQEAMEMYQLAESRKLVHMIDHEFRFLPERARMKELIDEGYLGQLLMVHSTAFYGPRGEAMDQKVTVARPWNWWSEKSKGGGLLGAGGSHLIDALRHFFGDIAGVYGQTETFAKYRKLLDSEEIRPVTSDDAYTFICRFENGALGTVAASHAARHGTDYAGMATLEAYGSQGTLMLGKDGKLRGGRERDKEAVELPIPERLVPPSVAPLVALFVLLAQQFIRGIKEGKEVIPSFYDGMKHQEVMDAVLLSQTEGRWVTLPLQAHNRG